MTVNYINKQRNCETVHYYEMFIPKKFKSNLLFHNGISLMTLFHKVTFMTITTHPPFSQSHASSLPSRLNNCLLFS